jgi:hypothetical protein
MGSDGWRDFLGPPAHSVRRKRCNIQISDLGFAKTFIPMVLATVTLISSFTRTTRAIVALYPQARAGAAIGFSMAVALLYRGSRQDVYNILWAVVFGFATLNILSLAARRMEPARRGLSFGELMAVAVVVVAVFLLGWEMLNLFHIFPIKLQR